MAAKRLTFKIRIFTIGFLFFNKIKTKQKKIQLEDLLLKVVIVNTMLDQSGRAHYCGPSGVACRLSPYCNYSRLHSGLSMREKLHPTAN